MQVALGQCSVYNVHIHVTAFTASFGWKWCFLHSITIVSKGLNILSEQYSPQIFPCNPSAFFSACVLPDTDIIRSVTYHSSRAGFHTIDVDCTFLPTSSTHADLVVPTHIWIKQVLGPCVKFTLFWRQLTIRSKTGVRIDAWPKEVAIPCLSPFRDI